MVDPVHVRCVPFFFPSLGTFLLSLHTPDLQKRDVMCPFFLSFKGLSTGPWVQLLRSAPESSPEKTCPKICHLRIPNTSELWSISAQPIGKALVFTWPYSLLCPASPTSSLCLSPLPFSALLGPPPLLSYSPSLLCHSLCLISLAAPSHKLQTYSCPRVFAYAASSPRQSNGFKHHLIKETLLNQSLENSNTKIVIIKQVWVSLALLCISS